MQPHLFAARLRTNDPRWDQITRRVIIVAPDERAALSWGDQLVERYIADGHALAHIDSRLENFCVDIPGEASESGELDWSQKTNADLKALWWCYGEPKGKEKPVALFGYVSADDQPHALRLWRNWVTDNAPGYRAGNVLSRYPASCAITNSQQAMPGWADILW